MATDRQIDAHIQRASRINGGGDPITEEIAIVDDADR